MNDMFTINATDARKNWSQIIDNAVREKPQFIKRTRDCMVLANETMFADMLSVYGFSATEFVETDGSVTLSCNELDLAENAATQEEAKLKLAQSILDYATDFYNDFPLWSSAPNRKTHIPYILRALLLDDIHKIGACISCQAGKN